MAYVALDLGSTYTKIALISSQGVLREKRLPIPPRLEHSSVRYEIDAEAYFSQMFSLLEEYALEGTQGILLSTQMHGYVLTDAHFNPLTPYVSWQDQVGLRYLEALRQVIGAENVAPAGVPLKANLALCSLWGRMQEGFMLVQGARLCTLGGYLIGRLTSRHICHITNAAPTGLADVQQRGWNLLLQHKVGMEGLILPEIEVDLKPVGAWKGIPVYPDLGDQQVCAAGAELTLDNCLHVSIGTAGLIGLLTQEWGCGAYENRPWIMPGCWMRTVSGLPGGRDIAALKDEIAETLPSSIPENDLWRLMATLSPDHLPAGSQVQLECIKTFYHDMAQSYRRAADQMERAITRLSFSGGCVAKNLELRQALLQAFDFVAFSSKDHDVMLGFQAIIKQIEDY
jgi:sugar (pentulose or hexulose) kinase